MIPTDQVRQIHDTKNSATTGEDTADAQNHKCLVPVCIMGCGVSDRLGGKGGGEEEGKKRGGS